MPREKHLRARESKGEIVPELALPDLGPEIYLVDLLHEAGTVSNNGQSIYQLSWFELLSWSIMTKTGLTSWEASVIMKLSGEYANAYNRSTDPEQPPPYFRDLTDEEREKKGSKIQSFFARFASKSKEAKRGLNDRGSSNTRNQS